MKVWGYLKQLEKNGTWDVARKGKHRKPGSASRDPDQGGHTNAKKGQKHQDQDPDGKHPASQTERFTFHLLAAGSWDGALSLTLGFGVGAQLG